MKRINFVLVSLAILIILIITSLSFSQELPKIAVTRITSTASGYTWRSDSPLSEIFTDLMINALLNNNRFRVLEKSKIDTILQKHNFQNYFGLIDPSNAARLGKLIGADVIVTANINSVIYIPKTIILLPLPPEEKEECRVVMNIQTIDVNTGKIIFSTSQLGLSPRPNYEKVLPISIPSQTEINPKKTRDIFSIVNIICNKVISNFLEKIDKKEIELNLAPLKGYIIKVISTSSGEITQFYMNLGKNSGIQVGDEIRIYREGEVILDPKTNEILDRELDLIAQAKVMKVKDKLSVALVTKKFRSMPIQQLDIVEVLR